MLMNFIAMPSASLAADNPILSACDSKTYPNAAKSPICNDRGTTTDPAIHIIHVAADLIAIITGLAAVIIIIVSGIQMITSAGSSDTVSGARKRITGALIGLVIVSLAWTIVTFLTDKLLA